MATKMPEEVLSHWAKLLENLQASPLEFYTAVEQAVQERQIPGVELSRVDWHEGGVLSAKREYLRISRGRLMYDVCAAPFGTGFFISSWLATPQTQWPLALFGILVAMVFGYFAFTSMFGFIAGTILFVIGTPILAWGFVQLVSKENEGWDDSIVAIPFLGQIYEQLFRPVTYYKIDTTSMFQQAVHSAVMDAVDQITTAKGTRGLTDLERKPVMLAFAAGKQ